MGPHLAYQGLGQADAAFLGQVDTELLVVLLLIKLHLVAVEQAALRGRVAHGLEHHLHEQGLELARDLFQRLGRVILRLATQGRETAEVGVDGG